MANVRQYMDTIALVLLRRQPRLLRFHVLPRLARLASSGSHALSSLIVFAARAAVAQVQPAAGAGEASAQQQQPQLAGEAAEALVAELAAAVAPWALSHVHVLRSASATGPLPCTAPAAPATHGSSLQNC